MADQADITAMRRAVTLAARGLGSTSPNPVVGCVVLDASGHQVGEGWHQRAGGPHAEVHALRAAGALARGDRKSTRQNSSHNTLSRMPSSA